jgi:hypothetical protein
MQAIGLINVRHALLFETENTTFRNSTTNGTRPMRHTSACARMMEITTCYDMTKGKIVGPLTVTEKRSGTMRDEICGRRSHV